MKILVKLPTKFRKDKFFNTLDIFYNLCDDIDNTFFLITLDNDDYIMNTNEVKEKLSSYKHLTYYFDNSISKLSATNRDLDKFTNWDILVLASDDTIPLIKCWDRIIREKMLESFPDTDGVLHFNDGHQEDRLNTLPILGKKYFDRFGYVQYPEYKSVYADNEFMEVSKLLNKTKYYNIVIIEHQHPDWGYGKHDYAHKENYQNLTHDSNLFNKRKSLNFNLNIN
jgi:hypothetical protein